MRDSQRELSNLMREVRKIYLNQKMMEKLKGTKHKFTKTSFCILEETSQKHKTTKDTDKKTERKKNMHTVQ